MEGIDYVIYDKLSTGKKGTTARINRLIESGDIDEETLRHFKEDLFMSEKEVLEAVMGIIKVN